MKKILLGLLAFATLTATAADKKISDLTLLPAASFATGDLFSVVDVSASETKKTRVLDLDTRYVVAPCTSTGSSIYYSLGVPTCLTIGTANTVKVSDGTNPSWAKLADANIATNAAITLSKLASLSISRAVVTDGSGVLTAAATTATEVGFVSGVTSTLCGINQSCTQTAKTFTSPVINGANFNFGTASNSNRIVLPTDTTSNLAGYTNTAGLLGYDSTQNLPVYNNGAGWNAVGGGSGSGTGSYEFFLNGNAETNTTTGWNLYAGEDPYTDGSTTVGSAHVVHSRTTTNGEVVRGAASFKLLKDAANRKGEGFTYLLAADPAESNASIPIYFSFDYTTSTNYVSGDLQLYAYDVTNSKILTVFDANNLTGALPAATANGKFTGRFYSNSGSKSYRISWHVNSTNALAWNVFVDTIHAGGANIVPGAIISPWTAFTPTLLNSWTNSTLSGFWRRVGEDMEILYKLQTTGTPSGTTLSFKMVPGYAVDNTKLLSNGDGMKVGYGGFYQTGVLDGNLEAFYNDNSGVPYFNAMYISSVTTSAVSAMTPTAPVTISNHPDYIWLRVKVPITSWTPGGAMSTSEVLLQTPAPLTATSSLKTPGGGNQYHALTGNSIVLPAGTFRLNCSGFFGNSGSVATYSEVDVGWFGANGADSITAPAAMTSLSGLTSLAGGTGIVGEQGTLPATLARATFPVVVKTTAASTTIFCVTFSNQTTSANARISIVASAEKVQDFSTFSVYGSFEVQSVTSSAKTPSSSGNFNAMTGNSLTLSAGTWRLFGTCHFNSNASNPAYTSTDCLWLSANGADTGASPAALSLGTGITVLTTHGTTPENFINLTTGVYQQLFTPAPMAIIRCSQTCTVFLDTYQVATTIANARVTAYVSAERLQ